MEVAGRRGELQSDAIIESKIPIAAALILMDALDSTGIRERFYAENNLRHLNHATPDHVIPAKAGIQSSGYLDSGSPRCFVRNDGRRYSWCRSPHRGRIIQDAECAEKR